MLQHLLLWDGWLYAAHYAQWFFIVLLSSGFHIFPCGIPRSCIDGFTGKWLGSHPRRWSLKLLLQPELPSLFLSNQQNSRKKWTWTPTAANLKVVVCQLPGYTIITLCSHSRQAHSSLGKSWPQTPLQALQSKGRQTALQIFWQHLIANSEFQENQIVGSAAIQV